MVQLANICQARFPWVAGSTDIIICRLGEHRDIFFLYSSLTQMERDPHIVIKPEDGIHGSIARVCKAQPFTPIDSAS